MVGSKAIRVEMEILGDAACQANTAEQRLTD